MARWLPVMLLCTASALHAQTPAELERGFVNPPPSARPQTWWHWVDGNVTRAGITLDLEAMQRVGIGGVEIFNVGCGLPPGPVRFLSDDWRQLIQHAIREADRLGLEVCLHNCAGWSSSTVSARSTRRATRATCGEPWTRCWPTMRRTWSGSSPHVTRCHGVLTPRG